jgi:VanZ family protein
MMLAIFLFSSGQALDTPLGLFDRILNKGGHVLGYGMLALAYWRMFEFKSGRRWLAWVLAVLYAMTDEFHQSFVPGRYPSLIDVLVFDNLGALLSLWLAGSLVRQKPPVVEPRVVEEELLPTKG